MQALSPTSDPKGFTNSSHSPSPETSIILPPSPARSEPSSGAARVLQLLRDRREGRLEKDWNVLELHQGDFDEASWWLKRDHGELLEYVEWKIR